MPQKRQIILEVARRARIRPVCGVYGPVANCTAFEEDVCSEMLRMHPEAAFAACWHERADGSQLWTLYSRAKGRTCDVSQIAREMGCHGDARHAQFVEPAFDVDALISERDDLLRSLAGRTP